MSGRHPAGVVLRTSPPAIPARFVRRERVERLLDRAATGPVTLISAGPGYGKTLGLAHWARHGNRPGPVAWLSVDSADDSVPGFWSSLLVAIQTSGAVTTGSGLFELEPAANFGLDEAARVVDRLATLPDPLVIVVDDVQHLRDRDVLVSIDLLLHRRPPPVRLMLSARFDPPLRLQRLVVADALTEIRAGELAFDQAEARELLTGSGLHLPAGSVDALVDRTRGWAAGLRLAAMGLDPHASEDGVARLRGSDRPVAEYLLEEVLDQLPSDDRRFLLFSSIADPVTADLADALTGERGAQARLERLEARNAFLVGLAGGRTWFTWHPLFRELLLHRLALEEPGMVRELHRRAAGWLEGTGDYVGAIAHLTDAGDWSAIGRLVTQRAAPDLVAAEGAALVDALEPTAARSRLDPTPATLLASALRNLRRFDYDAMLRDVQSAAAAAADGGADAAESSGDAFGIDVLVAVLQMAYARARDPHNLVDAAGQALKLIDQVPRHRVPATERYRAIATANLGSGLLWTGDLDAARTVLTDAKGTCRRWGLGLPELTAIGHLALLEAMRGRYPDAVRRGEQAKRIADRHGWGPEPQASAHMVALAWAALDEWRLDAANELIAAATDRGNPDAGCRVALAVLDVQVTMARGNVELAVRRAAQLRAIASRGRGLPPVLHVWARTAVADVELVRGDPVGARRLLPAEVGTGFTHALRTIALAKCLLAEDDPARALDLLVAALPQLAPYAFLAVQARMLAAVAAARMRRDAQALASIAAAVDTAAEYGIRRPFLEAGEPVPTLLGRHRRVNRRHVEFTSSLAPSPSPERTAADPAMLTEVLTERELSVLAYLPTYLRSGDIAADLFVSVNTVKSHLQAIYRKLGVTSRQAAVARARDLGLL